MILLINTEKKNKMKKNKNVFCCSCGRHYKSRSIFFSPKCRFIWWSRWNCMILLINTENKNEKKKKKKIGMLYPGFAIGALTLCMLGKIFSRRHFEIFILFLLENRIWHFMQTTVFMKFQILFSKKKKKNVSNLWSAEFAHSVVSVQDWSTFSLKSRCIWWSLWNCMIILINTE